MTKLVTTGVEFPDATIQTSAAVMIGSGQTWQAFTSPTRTNGTTYTNSTGRSIQIGVRIQAGSSITVNGVTAATSGINNATNFLGAIVPNGNTYVVSSGTGAVSNWAELR
jgi:hypothetical protein